MRFSRFLVSFWSGPRTSIDRGVVEHVKSKCLLIVLLRVQGLFTNSFKSCRPNFFLTVNRLLANI